MFSLIASRHDVPAFAVKGKEITNTQALGVKMDESHMYIGAMTRCCPVGYHKKWVGGYIFEQGFEETFESEFGL